MVLTREELLNSVRNQFGEDTSDDVLVLVENITDTITDLENKSKGQTDWKKKYEENDASWRKRYRDRFFSGSSEDDDPEDVQEPKKKIRNYNDLFKED